MPQLTCFYRGGVKPIWRASDLLLCRWQWWELPETCCWCNGCRLGSEPSLPRHQTAVSAPFGPTRTPGHRLQIALPPLCCSAGPVTLKHHTGATHTRFGFLHVYIWIYVDMYVDMYMIHCITGHWQECSQNITPSPVLWRSRDGKDGMWTKGLFLSPL